MKGIKSVFGSSNIPTELYIEYMDVKRHHADESFPYLASLYEYRYQNIDFDVIILSDDFALDFVLEHRNKLFPHVPVVFCGINNFSESRIADHKEITGIAEDIDIKGTIELALSLHPKTKRVAVVNDGTPPAVMMMQRVRRVMPQFKRMELIELFDLSVSDLKQALRRLPDDTVILHIHYYNDKDTGQNLTAQESFAITRGNSELPIYTAWDFQIGYGATGGTVTNGEVQGRIAAEMAMRILNEESTDSIPPIAKSPNTPMFDYNYMARFGISADDLPEESIIINEPISFYYHYKALIWLTAGFIFILLFLNIALMINIARRKKAEETLKESEGNLSITLNSIGDAVIATDTEGHIIRMNPIAEKITGWRLSEVKGRPLDEVFNIINEETRQRVESPVENVLREGVVVGLANHTILISKHGTEYPVDDSGAPIRNEQGKITGVVLVFRDVSEKRQTEEALRESEEKYRTVLESNPDPVVVSDIEGKILYFNPSFTQIFGWSLAECFDKKLDMFVPDEKQPEEIMMAEKLLRNESFFVVRTNRYNKQGVIIPVSISGTPYKDQDGSVIGSVINIRDVRDRLKLESQL